MKPSEVRVGNTIEHLFTDGKWREVMVSVRYLSRMEKYPKEFRGIEITDEHLQDRGFQDGRAQVGNQLYLEKTADGWGVVPETWRGTSLTMWADVQYLHEVQNLIHSLAE